MLSIIIPTLNEEKYIGNLLGCLINQSYKDFEIIIVDSSKDKTKEVIRQYRKYLDLKVISHRKGNISLQRDLGAKNAKHESLLFLDADVSFGKNFLKESINELRKRNLKIAGCHIYPDVDEPFYDVSFFLFRIFSIATYKIMGFNGCCVFSTRELHKKVNGFDSSINLGEDYDYVRRVSKFTNIGILNTKLQTSVRRFEKYGRITTGAKLILSVFYITFIGKIKKDIFGYKFGAYNGTEINRKL